MLNWITILPLVCAIFVTILGFFALFKDWRSRLNQLFFAFCVAMFFWLFGTFMMFYNRNNDLVAIWWDRFVYLGVTMMPALMHHFSLVFTGRKDRRRLLFLTYLGSFLFLFFSRTPYFVDGLYKYDWGIHTQARILHHIFLFYFYVGVHLFISNLWRYYKQNKDVQVRKQIIYVIFSFAIVMFVGGTAYLAAYNVDLKFPFSYFSGLIFPVVLFYSITRHRLMSAKVITTEIVVGLVLFILTAQLFTSQSLQEIIIRLFFTLVIAVLGFGLVLSVIKEVRRREEIQHLAEKLKKANEKLVELDKAKSEFLSIAAHQLRTPLTIIKGYISMIQDGDYGLCQNPKIDQVLGNVYQSNEHLIHLVNDFLGVSRIEAGKVDYKFASMQIATVLEEVIKENESRLKEKGLKLKLKIEKNLPLIQGDAEKFHHVIFNLLSNAIKYTEKGSIQIELFKKNNQIIFQIIDTGIGLSPTDKDQIFQKFYRSDNAKYVSASGVGLGLFVCRKFIEAHKGEMFATSPGLGKGSVFVFRLPLA